MQKYVAVLCALIITAFVAGCGDSGSTTAASATTISGITKDAISETEVSGNILFRRSINGIIAYKLNADKTASWNISPVSATADADPLLSLDVTGIWNVSDGILTLTPDSGGTPVQLTRIQNENSYWLVYDKSNTISRFYLDLAAAKAYNPAKMGGNVIGTPLVLSNPAAVSTFAGVAKTAGFTNNSTTTSLTTAKYNHPLGITTDGDNNFYIADYNNNVIRKIDRKTDPIGKDTIFAGSLFGFAGTADSTTGGGGTAATFNHPSSITTDGTNLYVTDSDNNSIRVIEIVNNAVTKVTTIGSTSGEAGSVDTKVVPPATTADVTLARFNQPNGITTDGTNLYVCDSGNHTIRKIVISTGAVSTLAGVSGVPGSADTTDVTAATFNQPARITTDGSNLYVTDFKNSTIRKIVIATGKVTTIAGIAGTVGSADTTPGVVATFNQPNGITTDGTNLYVTDSLAHTVRKIVIDTGAVTTIAGTIGIADSVDTADAAPATDTTPAKVVSFHSPIGITTDGVSLFVTDSNNHTIREIK